MRSCRLRNSSIINNKIIIMSGQAAAGNLVHLVLERDGHDQPWGFRLQGGADVGLPLSVQRVLVGTPAEGTFFKGDVIQKVSYTDTKGLSHQQAADLFDNAGNQIHVYVKRAGVVGPSSAAASAPLVNGGITKAPSSVAAPPPVSGGVALPGLSAGLATSNCDLPDSTSPTAAMSMQSQPHKFNPDLGVGSVQHLKMQDEHITGVKEPSNMPSQAEVAKQKANELLMKEKVIGSLDQIQQTQQTLAGVLPKGVVNKQYNTPLNLYSNDNIQDEIQKQAPKNPDMPQVELQPVGPFPVINPMNKPQKPRFGKGGLLRGYDPENSATWQIINEEESCHLVTEHGPTESKVYSI